MQKIIYIVLSVLLIVGSGFAVNYYKKLDKCKEDLESCKKVPDFRPALFNVKEFVGARKRFHFKVKCSNDIEFDFFDSNECETLIMNDVTNKDVTLVKDDVKKTIKNSRYIADWVENWNFYVDLSNSDKWQIESENNTITFNSPSIKIARLSRSGGESYLVYILDKAVWSNDQKALLNMSMNTDAFASVKAKNYLKENYSNLKNEMEKSIKEFIKALISKMGYTEEYNIKVNFEDIGI